MSLTVWTNHEMRAEAREVFAAALAQAGHRLVQSAGSSRSVLEPGASDPALAEADIAYGQPSPEDIVRSPRLRWVALSTAGYTRYDRDDFRAAMQARGTPVCNASAVFADPCAQQMLAGMLALARNLPAQLRNQDGPREWRYLEDRFTASVLTGQSVLLLGYGAIGRRLAELLAPFGMKLLALRRQIRSERAVRVIAEEAISSALAEADHVVNILPENDATRGYVNARRLACCKRGAHFYNVGRGTTVDQPALMHALESGRLGAAYLDVTDPEPLPPDHALWTAPNCFITPHTAGGRRDQDEALAEHFLTNLAAFERGESMTDRVV